MILLANLFNLLWLQFVCLSINILMTVTLLYLIVKTSVNICDLLNIYTFTTAIKRLCHQFLQYLQ